MKIYYPREYLKDGIIYILDVDSLRGPAWVVYMKETGKHVTFGYTAEIALRNAGLKKSDGVNYDKEEDIS